MDHLSEIKPVKQICVGILAHVDAGKTTLSEALLYSSGTIRSFGRVDNQDAFLDTNELERARGITIFSKQAVLKLAHTVVTLLDTPGHVDFSAEMERTLQVLDYAILVISASDGVQGHTRTLWKLLEKYQIPVILFINKMDQPGTDADRLLLGVQKELDGRCVSFPCGKEERTDAFYENIAVCDETLLERYLERLEQGKSPVSDAEIASLIEGRKLFPCFFGSCFNACFS